VKADLSNLHELVLEHIRAYYEGMGREYANSIRDLASSSAGEISDASREAGDKLKSAAQSLLNAADAITPELKTAITTGADYLRRHLDDFDAAFRQHFPKAVTDLQMALSGTSKQIDLASRVLEGMVTASKLAGEYSVEWQNVSGNLRDVNTVLERNTRHLDLCAKTIGESAGAIGRASAALDRSLAAFHSAAKRSQNPPAAPNGDAPGSPLWRRLLKRVSLGRVS
jgi:hypothetical protein